MNTNGEEEAEAKALVGVIEAAFDGVSREGGVSWSESRVIDDNGTEAEQAEARFKDKDQNWQELIGDPTWDPEMGVGGWNFLDSIGYRYYLPAAMIRSIKAGYDVGIQFSLTLSKFTFRKLDLQRWSSLNPGQQYAVARFLRFMIARDERNGDELEAGGWKKAYRSYWASLPPPIGDRLDSL